LILPVVAPAEAQPFGGAGNTGSGGPIKTISAEPIPAMTWWSAIRALPMNLARLSSAVFA
jgi:hypothetical protein